METIERFIKYNSQGGPEDWFDLEFYDNQEGNGEPIDKDLVVQPAGAKICFRKVQGSDQRWEFHDLTIHPLGAPTDRLDIRWIVFPELVMVLHREARIRRRYSYTLALKVGPGIAYLDPQMVDIGGPGPTAG